MNSKVFSIILGVAGQFLIVALFVWVFDDYIFGGADVKWLDFSVVSVLYWLWALSLCIPAINTKDKSQKAIGGLGIKLYATTMYTVIALGYALIAMGSFAFKWQLCFQIIFFFCWLVAINMSFKASEKTKEVYEEEQVMKIGKANIKSALQNAYYNAQDKHFPAELVERLKRLSDEARYITPSVSADARMLDIKIESDCDSIRIASADFKMNEAKIVQTIYQLENDVQRRKKI